MDYQIVIIGSGISGSTLAERYANSLNKKVLIVEKRDHIGGNCYDYINKDGILVSKYGAHIFHTNFEEVWNYVNRFSKWFKYKHAVLAKVGKSLIPVPVNITTVNKLFNLNIKNELDMKKWLKNEVININYPKNSKEAALARVGPRLYEKIFKNYTKKQWDKYPEELDASVLNRIPVRHNFNDKYFSDKYQALPTKGYTQIFKNMLNNNKIKVLLSTDYFKIKNRIRNYEKLFYTGPIDRYFDFKYGIKEKLEYRSLKFVHKTINKEYYQQNAVINYPNDFKFTRIVEYKHFRKQKNSKTTIVKEYSKERGEPYYPVPNPKNHQIYAEYKKEADKLKDIYFVGRLANYKYFNMDEAFKNSLDLFKNLESKFIS